MDDYISREDAINFFENMTWYHVNRIGQLVDGANSDTGLYKAKDVYKGLHDIPAAAVAPVVRCKDCIHNNDCDIQYSAQPEPLTDKEQRIFLAAMGREEKVCKQVDEECRDCREPYEDSLVRVCHEIVRKVKGALWET